MQTQTPVQQSRRKRAPRPRGTGRIFQPRGCKVWYIKYWSDGKRICESSKDLSVGRTGLIKAEAEALMQSRLHQKNEGEIPVQLQRGVTYADLRSWLLAYYEIKKLKSLQTLADGSVTIWGLKPLDEFMGYVSDDKPGKIRLKDINSDLVDRFIRERRAEGVSDATIRGSLALLRQALSIAVDKKKISQAPKFDLPPAPEAKDDFITEPEFKKLVDALPSHLHPFVTFLFYQGTRSSEAKKVIWAQIDLERATYSPRASSTKTNDSGVRALHDEVVKALKSIKAEHELTARVLDTTNFLKSFKKACLKLKLFSARYTWQCGQCGMTDDSTSSKSEAPSCAGYDDEHRHVAVAMRWGYVGLTVHGLRRSAVVYYRERGVPDRVIMEITGHKTLSVFHGYSAVNLQTQKAAMRQAKNTPAQLKA